MKENILYNADVVVCGAGPAGVCTAIASARNGADTLLVERGGALGGIWTSGLLSWIIDCHDKTGILKEIIDKIIAEKRGYFGNARRFIAEPEYLKYLLEDMCQKAGVKVLLYTTLCGANVENDRITSINVTTKLGVEKICGKVFVDCTGDGDLGYFAGCNYSFGDDGGKKAQPMSLIALVDGIDAKNADHINCTIPRKESYSHALNILKDMNSVGISPSYHRPSLFHVQDNLWIMMTNHQYGYSPFSVKDLTTATLNARKEIFEQVEALKNAGELYKNMRVVVTGSYIGVREGRRILGEYTISDQDIIEGKKFEDGVCRINSNVDVHPTKLGNNFNDEHKGFSSQPYDVPLRACIAKDVSNLLMAGRCISGSFFAHSCYRMTGDAATMGEAVGKYASTLIK